MNRKLNILIAATLVFVLVYSSHRFDKPFYKFTAPSSSIPQLYVKVSNLTSSSVAQTSTLSSTLSSARTTASSMRIPMMIHQTWKSRDLPSERIKQWSASWRQCFPNWTYKLWTDEDNEKLIQEDFPWFLSIYRNYSHNINRADAIRYFYMHKYGGIYADLDTVCLRDFWNLLRNSSLVLGAMEGHYVMSLPEGYVQNSFMASSPGHPLWMILIKRLVDGFKNSDKKGAEDKTGPFELMRAVKEYRKQRQIRKSSPIGQDLMIYAPVYFNPFSWIKKKPPSGCATFGKMSRKDEKKCLSSFTDSYVVQFHVKSWGGGKMK